MLLLLIPDPYVEDIKGYATTSKGIVMNRLTDFGFVNLTEKCVENTKFIKLIGDLRKCKANTKVSANA